VTTRQHRGQRALQHDLLAEDHLRERGAGLRKLGSGSFGFGNDEIGTDGNRGDCAHAAASVTEGREERDGFCLSIVSGSGQNWKLTNRHRTGGGSGHLEQMAEHDSTPAVPPGLPSGLAALAAEVGQLAKPRPVERWNPPFCGDIDMEIAADGSWSYMGTPIGREALVRLFASILRREPDGRHVLVTPVEKVGIRVADAPFLAVEMTADELGADQVLSFRTNVGDIVAAGPDNPLRFAIEAGTGGLKPYLLVRGRLEALVSRSRAQELVDLAVEADGASGIWSGGQFFALPGDAGA
jgi:hypothetical protein